MKLMNNTTGEHQALPEEMLTKETRVLSIQVMAGVKMTDFPTLSIPQLVKSLPFYMPEA